MKRHLGPVRQQFADRHRRAFHHERPMAIATLLPPNANELETNTSRSHVNAGADEIDRRQRRDRARRPSRAPAAAAPHSPR